MADKIKIMVVEDEWIIANDIKESLNTLGYEVTATAASGKEALKKAENNPPHLVMMDIMLRGPMDGIETAGQLRALLDIPVIYLTAYADDELIAKAKITEPFGYMLKPFKERELQITIEMALYKDRMERERKVITQKLQEALENVRTLRGLIPICASCKKIRDDKGYWHQVESYIQRHSEAEFTHGICLDCARKLNPEFYEDEE